jgi:hypothetical protein
MNKKAGFGFDPDCALIDPEKQRDIARCASREDRVMLYDILPAVAGTLELLTARSCPTIMCGNIPRDGRLY